MEKVFISKNGGAKRYNICTMRLGTRENGYAANIILQRIYCNLEWRGLQPVAFAREKF